LRTFVARRLKRQSLDSRAQRRRRGHHTSKLFCGTAFSPVIDQGNLIIYVGDVSWAVPTLHLSVTTAPESAWHAWPVVACGGMSIGHKGMIHAAKTLAATMVDLFEDARQREAIQAEFKEKTRGFVYKPYISDGPPPLPKQ